MGSDPPPQLPNHHQVPEPELRNFTLLALFRVIHRIGWIFKTESIVMPAFMDFIGGGPVLRGFLPVLNRLGFAIPPVLYARRLTVARHKKNALFCTTLAQAVPFAVLSLLWLSDGWQTSTGQPRAWLPWFFLALYGVFFMLTGMSQLAEHTLQGKLVRPNRRGRLFTASIVVGAPVAITAAYFLMGRWLERPDGGYGWIFAVPALTFSAAAFIVLDLKEPPDDFTHPARPPLLHIRDAIGIVLGDANFFTLAMVAMLFAGGVFTLFPHYQAMAREQLGLTQINLVVWVCVQNVATAVASLLAGPLADRFGNRVALHVVILGGALGPIVAVVCGHLQPELARSLFWLVFLPLGLTPVAIRLLTNYTLEIAEREHHPQYVSTMGLCFAVPVVIGAPLVGWLVELVGYDLVFLLGAVAITAGGLLTFRLIEPRHHLTASIAHNAWVE